MEKFFLESNLAHFRFISAALSSGEMVEVKAGTSGAILTSGDAMFWDLAQTRYLGELPENPATTMIGRPIYDRASAAQISQ